MGEEKEDGASAATIPWTMMSALEERVRAHDEDDEKKDDDGTVPRPSSLFVFQRYFANVVPGISM